jgi:hypothetical protein
MAHSFALLWGAGHHLHLFLADHDPLVVHAHGRGMENANTLAMVDGDIHDHQVIAVSLTAIAVRNCEYSPIAPLSETPNAIAEECIETDQDCIPRSAREAPPPLPLDGHISSYSGLDPPLSTPL